MSVHYDEAPNIAIFVDYENVAIGARDAKYDDFDIQLILERLLDKGNIVVKRSYADWDSFKSAKKQMHEASFEMIEIPHFSYSGKNSADIRMVVDAIDLSYTKRHVQVFCIITGDSDFSPLVSKLRENNKHVIGVGVKNATSRLLVENCDEYIFYDDLIRDKRKKKGNSSNSRSGRKGNSESKTNHRNHGNGSSNQGSSKSSQSQAGHSSANSPTTSPGKSNGSNHQPSGNDENRSAADRLGPKEEALEHVLQVVESLFRERDEHIYGSLIKQVLKRKKPHFNETFYGYRNFNELLEDATIRDLLETEKDTKSGGYIVHGFGSKA